MFTVYVVLIPYDAHNCSDCLFCLVHWRTRLRHNITEANWCMTVHEFQRHFFMHLDSIYVLLTFIAY